MWEEKPTANFPHYSLQKNSFTNTFIILLLKMGKIQLVREQRNQNQNKTFAALFQLLLSCVMKVALSWQEKKQQLQNLRAKSLRVARSLRYSSSNSAHNLQKFLLPILLLQLECPAVPESLREKNNQRLASFNYSLGFALFCQDQRCLTSHNTQNLLRQWKKKQQTFLHPKSKTQKDTEF